MTASPSATEDDLSKPCLAGDGSRFPERSIGFLMWHALKSWQREMDAALAEFGLGHQQFVMLVGVQRLRDAGFCPSQARLAELLRYEPMMISKGLRVLEAAGLLERHVHPDDPRAKEVGLSQQGVAVLRRAQSAVEAAHDRHFAVLGESIHSLRASLRLLNGMMPEGR